VKTKLEVIPSCLAKGKLYTEVEIWTFYAPIIEEVIDRIFGFYDQFDDLFFKYLDSYMSSQIYKVIKMPGWSIPIEILCAIVFTNIINSYWPSLISMFRYLKKILSKTVDTAKGVEKIQDNHEHGVELINMLTKQPPGSKPEAHPNPTTSSSSRISDSNYCLWCWTISCVFCGFFVAIFIAAVFISITISLMESVMEPHCGKIEHQLSNDGSSSWGPVSAAISIYHQDETGTTLVMPCDGITLDKIGNEYQIDGAYKLSCIPQISFNYVTSIKTWRVDHCCTYPDWKYEKRNHG
jgi:hypothetical protein